MFSEPLKSLLTARDYSRIHRIGSNVTEEFIVGFINLCKPASVYVSCGTSQDLEYVRAAALRSGEEMQLATEGHTAHFDNYDDQARDREKTRVLVPTLEDYGLGIQISERQGHTEEIFGLLSNVMRDREMFVSFYALCPLDSEFSLPCIQISDSSYVIHSENILYRQGYSEFLRQGMGVRPFKFVHSEGELDQNRTSLNFDKRRIYVDLEEETVYSVNTQYGGNTIGLKKLGMRLAIKRAMSEGWLNEHMFIMGVNGPAGRRTYFTGAFPSMCGKTSTSMVMGETVIGDDIAFLRKKDGEVRAANTEKGVFGIIKGVNPADDPMIWDAINRPGEVIFSNILVSEDGGVYWEGKGTPSPNRGRNHSGQWAQGKRDNRNNTIPPSHPNARFNIALKMFDNLDPHWDDPKGVAIGGIMYGGRDSDTSAPVQESFDWVHGIVTFGASLESETTAATLGKEGVRELNPMSNLDFLSVPVAEYVKENIAFCNGIEQPPRIFGVNYFLKDREGNFLSTINDKRVWLKWMELRVHDDVGFIVTPTGRMPLYSDLKPLFAEALGVEYSEKIYSQQFLTRIPENLAKLDRVERAYRTIDAAPAELFRVLSGQRERLAEARKSFGDCIPPQAFKHK